jgi:hypothetical protein
LGGRETKVRKRSEKKSKKGGIVVGMSKKGGNVVGISRKGGNVVGMSKKGGIRY